MEPNSEQLAEMVDEIDEAEDVDLTPWERNFIGDMVDREPSSFSPAQRAKIQEIYDRYIN